MAVKFYHVELVVVKVGGCERKNNWDGCGAETGEQYR
jgi:hypothetical protein